MVDVCEIHDHGHFIGGSERHRNSTFDVLAPNDRRVVARVASGDNRDVDAAVDSATAALPKWAEFTPARKEKLFFDVADLLEENKDRFSMLCFEPGWGCRA